MNKILKLFTIIIFFFLSLSALSAATVVWIGGTGNWDNASNWDTGIIPSALDDVVISGGHVTIPASYDAYALSVYISNSGVLEIIDLGTLQIDNPAVNGINISTGSSLLNFGLINILNASTIGINNSGGTLHNQSTGNINITSSYAAGIKNYGTGAVLTNDGLININEVLVGDGIYNEQVANNNVGASISIVNSDSYGIRSSGGVLTNYGNITIDSTGNDGMNIYGNIFENFGDVEISHCLDGNGSNGAMGIYAPGIKNEPSGSFYIHHIESSAMRTYGDIENSGLIEIYDNDYIGLFVIDGTLSNQDVGSIKIKNNNNDAIYLSSTTLENDGFLLFKNNTGITINVTSGSQSENKTNGIVKGNGLISGGYFNDSGSINPGDTIGSLEIYGYLPSMPTYNMEIAGAGNAGLGGTYDLLTLNFSNSYQLQGTVNVTFLPGYIGVSQDTFYMFSIPLGYSGTFNTVNLAALPSGLVWQTIYSSTGVKFIIDGTISWIGTVSQDWDNPLNWDKNIVPGENNDVIIQSGTAYSAHVNISAVIKSIQIMSGASFFVDQNLTIQK